MSWSIRLIGKPENVVAALDTYGETLTGQSKQEFDEAKPALATLVHQNIGCLVDVDANGHASFSGDTKTYGNCTVRVTPNYAQLV